ncbi:transposon ty3-I gag-pol polyprotein [Tanacetum coccineum]
MSEKFKILIENSQGVIKALVKSFNLPTEPRHSLYQIGWIKKELALKVTKICKVPLAIGKYYNELVICDVIDIKACHVLLERPWQHDMDSTHQGKSNMYLFRWSRKTIAMLSLSVISPMMKLENKTLANLVASTKEFQADRKETGVSYALVVKGIEDVMENAIPAVVKPLIAEFGKTVADDTPITLPPLRNIQHQIDLSRKSTLLVSISNEVLGFNSIKELYASDKDFCNTLMELETTQHRGEFLLLDGYLFNGNRLCIPKTSLRSQLIKEIHAGGLIVHLGRDKTIVSVESRFDLPQLKKNTGAFVKRCVMCQEAKDCDDGLRPEEQHLVVPCFDEEIVKFPTQPATTEISGEDEEEPLMMLGSGPNIIKEDFSNDLDGQHSTEKKMVCAKRRTWDPGITWLKILKEHLEDKKHGPYKIPRKINDNAYVVDLPNTMSILKTFNVSHIYEFHSEDVNEGKHSRTSSSKERENDEDMIQKLVEEYMVSKNK